MNSRENNAVSTCSYTGFDIHAIIGSHIIHRRQYIADIRQLTHKAQTMISSRYSLLFLTLATCNAFAPAPFNRVTTSAISMSTEAEEAPPADEGDANKDDILNSPAFLKRKLDVLKEDIEKCDAQTSKAKELLEENRVEMGEKIEKIKVEVSHFVCAPLFISNIY